MSGGGESVKVAVRVRPFNTREKERGAKLVVEMEGATTRLLSVDGGEEPKTFTFDYSYWSHDGFTEQDDAVLAANPGSKYASQQNVFNDLGQGVLDNAFQGFNCSLFAYGQTGSGKSYSMVGYGPNKGIVPITCDVLFQTIEKSQGAVKYEVTFSMLEIYNEQVRDLLQKVNPKGGLAVRQNPKEGLFYVQALKKVAVGSYREIESRIEEGTSNRTVAATQMNATSSRAHTVVTIQFDQISKNESGQETKKTSVINLVDLAGSERADSTGATGDRLKEGANINKSLSSLGNVISALADLSMGKKKVLVPYRDSVLTKLLQNALGGNSKTIMIAALSPADINHDETLGTLRYADRAKKIKNKAVVNENPVEKLIRELRAENERLKTAMSGGTLPSAADQSSVNMSPEEKERMRQEMMEEIKAQLSANQEAMEDFDWDKKHAQQKEDDPSGLTDKAVMQSRKNKEPYFANLNEDNMLSGVVFYFLAASETTIGRKDADPQPTVMLSGLSISKKHAIITNVNGEITLKPYSSSCKIKVNGLPLTGARNLEHLDRVMFGSNHMFVFHNPINPKAPEGTPNNIEWDFAQKELAEARGLTAGGNLTKDQQRAQDQILELLPMVNEVNAVSEELDKHKGFEIVLLSEEAQEGNNRETKVMVKMKDLLNRNSWLWERGKFINRRYVIQDLYQRYIDGDEGIMNIPKEEDPFWEPAEDVLIGTANAFLQSLGFNLDFDGKITVTDFKGKEEGSLIVCIEPCDQKGKSIEEDDFVDEPNELLGKPYHFKVSIRNGEVHKSRFSKGLKVKYKCYNEQEFTLTNEIKDTLSPEWNHSRIVSIPSVTEDVLAYFENSSIKFSLYGKQIDSAPDSKLSKLTTKELRQMENMQDSGRKTRIGSMAPEGDGQDEAGQIKGELLLLKRKYERLEKKERRLQEICKQWEDKPREEQLFDPFYRSVSAVAYSTGSKLKTRVHMLNKIIQGHKALKEIQNGDQDKMVKEGNGKVVQANGGGGGGGGEKTEGGSRACSVM
ncbi:kinesin-like protein KIF28P isoform X2 [Asterias rubens]|uniref:kinesin-like protein KIF28P isoform X2 n=1 Tax=Asterias rubens TaxID=7604 RepID=UPI001455D6B5|nr:kinesin-like protein KIF28P isoform X2 [Asterias rubens]